MTYGGRIGNFLAGVMGVVVPVCHIRNAGREADFQKFLLEIKVFSLGCIWFSSTDILSISIKTWSF